MADSPVFPQSEIEGLIAALRGVLATRVTLGNDGQIEEIHVLGASDAHPKQTVRDIESALSAGLGISIDRRLISIARLQPDDDADHDSHDATAPQLPHDDVPDLPAEPPRNPVVGRYIFVGYDSRTRPDVEAACRVTIQRGTHTVSGAGNGPSTPLGRAQAAARALFSAITVARDDGALGLEGVTLVESEGRGFVLVSATASSGRHTLPLTGAAAVHRSPEEAAILASLQATNRWSEYDG